jgi:predicted ribosome quality control (RQC) complex YloA/Tae2 family protein
MRGYDIVRGIITGANIPPDVAEEAIYRLGIKKDLRPTDLGASFIGSVLEGVDDFILSVKKSPVPGIVLDQSGSLYGFYPFEPKHLISLGYVFRRFPSFNEAIDTFYSQIEVTKALQKSPELSGIEKSIEKLRSQIIDAGRS